MSALASPKGCWVDLFEERDFHGRARRLFGPGHYLRVTGVAGGIPIASLAAGMGAWILCFDEGSPLTDAFWILPGRMVSNLLETQPGRRMNSLVILDREPAAHDAHYAAYRWKIDAS